MSATPESLLPLIGAFYEAAAEPGLWPKTALRLAQIFQSESCLLITADAQFEPEFLGVTENITGKVWDDYRAYY